MIIRPEKTEDAEQIRQLLITAFKSHPHSNQTEHLIVEKLREANSLTLSLVADDNEKVVGHIAFSEVTLNGIKCGCYGLGPVAVLPEIQNRGIGSKLITEGLAQMELLEAKAILVLGEPEFYAHFGFTNYTTVTFPHAPAKYFMIKTFADYLPQGLVEYHAAFS